MSTKRSEPFDHRATELPPNSIVAPIEVDNPLAIAGGEADRIIVMRSLRGDPLAWMYHHKQIRLENALYLAGRRWQMLYERSEIGGIQAMDITKDPVDGGGGFAEPITDGHRRAVKSLSLAKAVIIASAGKDRGRGETRAIYVYDILGSGMFPVQVAEARGVTGENANRKVMREFRRSLTALAENHEWQR